ncbi:MAG: glycosyltransferase family 4 protein [Candidatus Dormiibacterota bacterium]
MTARAESTSEPHPDGNGITFLIYSPFPKYSGGRENWLHNLAPHLSERGRAVRVIAYATNRATFHSLERSGIRVVALPSVRYFYNAFRVLNRLTLGLLQYLDIFFCYPIIAGAYLAWTRPQNLVCMNAIPEGMLAFAVGVPYTVSVRGEVAKGLSGRLTFLEHPLSWLERLILGHAATVLANGRDTKDRLAAAGITSTVVPNGVDFARFSAPAPGQRFALEIEKRAAGRPVIAFIATMDAIHGVTDAIESALLLKEGNANFVLAMVGKGDTGPLKSRAQALGLDGFVEFMGETSSVAEVLQRSSIFLGLSRGDVGMSMSALEAMAAGVPIVARDSPAYRQLIDDGHTGLLVSNSKELAECCLRLLRDPETARSLGRNAQAVARDYDWPRIAGLFLAAMG